MLFCVTESKYFFGSLLRAATLLIDFARPLGQIIFLLGAMG